MIIAVIIFTFFTLPTACIPISNGSIIALITDTAKMKRTKPTAYSGTSTNQIPSKPFIFTDKGIITHNNKTTTKDYDKLIAEYQFLANNKPPSLIIVEKAKPSEWPDRPKKSQLIIATIFLSILFSFLVALVLDRYKTSKRAA